MTWKLHLGDWKVNEFQSSVQLIAFSNNKFIHYLLYIRDQIDKSVSIHTLVEGMRLKLHQPTLTTNNLNSCRARRGNGDF